VGEVDGLHVQLSQFGQRPVCLPDVPAEGLDGSAHLAEHVDDRVSGEECPPIGVIKADAAGAVPWHVDDGKARAFDGVAVFQRLVHGTGFGAGQWFHEGVQQPGDHAGAGGGLRGFLGNKRGLVLVG